MVILWLETLVFGGIVDFQKKLIFGSAKNPDMSLDKGKKVW